MEKAFFSGACTAMVTPFQDGKVDFTMMEKLLRRQIEAGVQTIVIAGTTGEAATLSDSEKIQLIKKCKIYTGNSCKIIAGTGSNSTSHTVILSKMAQDVGADGLLIVSPYYNKANSDGLYVHFWTIAQEIKIPIIIYNVPSRTGVDIPVSVYEQLSKLPQIVGVKEASCDLGKIGDIRAACDDSFRIWSGNDHLTVPIISMGGVGVISVLSNIYPKEVSTMCTAALQGDFATAAAMQVHMQRLCRLLFDDINPMPVKYAMKLIGYDCGKCRLPLTELTMNHKSRLRAYFESRPPA